VSEKLTVLIVDDDRMMVKTLTDILRIKGYEVVPVHSAQEGLERLKAGEFQCVLTDMRMPGMDGLAFYRAIKNFQPTLPVVLMTAYSADEVVRNALAEGAIGALTKPINIEALLRFLSHLRKERSVIILDDDLLFAQSLANILRGYSFNAIAVTDPDKAMQLLRPDGQVLLLDMKLDKVSGLSVLQRIREVYPKLPVILMTGYKAEVASEIEAARQMYIHACLYKPFHIDELVNALTDAYRCELRGFLV